MQHVFNRPFAKRGPQLEFEGLHGVSSVTCAKVWATKIWSARPGGVLPYINELLVTS